MGASGTGKPKSKPISYVTYRNVGRRPQIRFAGSKSIAKEVAAPSSSPAPAPTAAPSPAPAPAPTSSTKSSTGKYTTGDPEFDADQIALNLAKKKWDEQPSGSESSFAAYKEYSSIVKSISDKAVSRNKFD